MLLFLPHIKKHGPILRRYWQPETEAAVASTLATTTSGSVRSRDSCPWQAGRRATTPPLQCTYVWSRSRVDLPKKRESEGHLTATKRLACHPALGQSVASQVLSKQLSSVADAINVASWQRDATRHIRPPCSPAPATQKLPQSV
ncbi:hypothetical protein ACLKA7_004482 [Drosophila subpalustris]